MTFAGCACVEFVDRCCVICGLRQSPENRSSPATIDSNAEEATTSPASIETTCLRGSPNDR